MKTKNDARQMFLPFAGIKTRDSGPAFPRPRNAVPAKSRPSVPRAVVLEEDKDEKRLASFIHSLVRRPLTIAFNDNAVQLVSFQDDKKGMRNVRISRYLLRAPLDVWTEVALWVKDSKRHKLFSIGSASEAFVETSPMNRILREARKKRQKNLESKGDVYDLARIFDRLNRKYFDGKCNARIGWSNLSYRKRSRTIRLGSFLFEDNIILIHPALDTKKVPLFVLEATLFHEMMHWRFRDRRHPSGRRMMHFREFEERVAEFPDHKRSETWIARNIDFLIRRRREVLKKKLREKENGNV